MTGREGMFEPLVRCEGVNGAWCGTYLDQSQGVRCFACENTIRQLRETKQQKRETRNSKTSGGGHRRSPTPGRPTPESSPPASVVLSGAEAFTSTQTHKKKGGRNAN